MLIFCLAIIAGCAPKVQTEEVDLNAVNETITQLVDKYHNAWNAEDIDVINAIVANDGLFCGSDPSEQLDKTALLNMYEQLFADTATDYSYSIDLRKIKLAADGNSAIVMDHIIMNGWTPLMQMRQTVQIVKTGNAWEIDYISWSFIAKNEDVERLNKTLE